MAPEEHGDGRRGPLDGFTVVEVGRMVSVPYAASLLGDMGARVIKLEPPEGDPLRRADRSLTGEDSAGFLAVNRNKESVVVDFDAPEARAVVLRLAAEADVWVDGLRPGTLERHGLGETELRARNPRLIYVAVHGFGADDRLARRSATDLVLQAMSGLMHLTGEPGRPPLPAGAPVVDGAGAIVAAFAVALGLYARERGGRALRVDVPLFDVQLSMMSNYVPGFVATGRPAGPVGGGHPQIVPYQVFATADLPLVVACLTEEFWRRLCVVLETEPLTGDPRFATNADRVVHRDELVPLLSRRFVSRSATAWESALVGAGVPCSRVSGLGEVLAEPQAEHDGTLVTLPHPLAGPIRVAGHPVRLDATPARRGRAAPLLGEDTETVLAGIGYSAEERARLRERGVVAGPAEVRHA